MKVLHDDVTGRAWPGPDGGLDAAAPLPPSVNYHLLVPCNMRCRGCFATFHDIADGMPKGMLPKRASLGLVDQLATDFEKITFAGGEPTLCPWLPELIGAAKSRGRTTMVVTNGTRLSRPFLDAVRDTLDWVTLSIDSPHPSTHVALGRAVNGRAMSPDRYLAIADEVRRLGMGLKVNTVVSKENVDQDFTNFLWALAPSRWKLLQILPVDGQNDRTVGPLLIDRQRFEGFYARHRLLEEAGIEVVPEDNEAMTGSYAMVDPQGRFFDNTAGRHRYSDAILEIGLRPAWRQVGFHPERFVARGGVYDWSRL